MALEKRCGYGGGVRITSILLSVWAAGFKVPDSVRIYNAKVHQIVSTDVKSVQLKDLQTNFKLKIKLVCCIVRLLLQMTLVNTQSSFSLSRQ